MAFAVPSFRVRTDAGRQMPVDMFAGRQMPVNTDAGRTLAGQDVCRSDPQIFSGQMPVKTLAGQDKCRSTDSRQDKCRSGQMPVGQLSVSVGFKLRFCWIS